MNLMYQPEINYVGIQSPNNERFTSRMYQPEYDVCLICGDKLVKKYNTKDKKVTTLKGELIWYERIGYRYSFMFYL